MFCVFSGTDVCVMVCVVVYVVVSVFVYGSSNDSMQCLKFLDFLVGIVVKSEDSLSLSKTESDRRPLSLFEILFVIIIHGGGCVAEGGIKKLAWGPK